MSKIVKVKDQTSPQKEGQQFVLIPLQFLLDNKSVSDVEADTLYGMWKGSSPGSKLFATNGIDRKVLNSLKDKGYVEGIGPEVAITDKGRKLIIERVTNEQNAMLIQAGISKDPSWSEIQAKKNHRPIQAHVKKASKEQKAKETYNLRKESIKRMAK